MGEEEPPAETVPLSTERLRADPPGPGEPPEGWVLRRRADERVVGRLRVTATPHTDEAEIGWDLACEACDPGYAEEVVSAAVGYAVDVRGASRVTALVPPDDAARRAARRAGLAPTGRPDAGNPAREVFAVRIPPVDPETVTVRAATPEEVLGLRQRVLRPHEPPSALLADADAEAVDLAAVTSTQRVVACARLSRDAPPWAVPTAATAWWRLRNMVTSAQARGLGLGQRLVDAALQRARAAGAERVWCAARTTSVGFYTRCGFQPVTDVWDDPALGPHVGMEHPA